MKAVSMNVAETLGTLWTGQEEALEFEASGGLEGKYLGKIWKGQQTPQSETSQEKHTPPYFIHSQENAILFER